MHFDELNNKINVTPHNAFNLLESFANRCCKLMIHTSWGEKAYNNKLEFKICCWVHPDVSLSSSFHLEHSTFILRVQLMELHSELSDDVIINEHSVQTIIYPSGCGRFSARLEFYTTSYVCKATKMIIDSAM